MTDFTNTRPTLFGLLEAIGTHEKIPASQGTSASDSESSNNDFSSHTTALQALQQHTIQERFSDRIRGVNHSVMSDVSPHRHAWLNQWATVSLSALPSLVSNATQGFEQRFLDGMEQDEQARGCLDELELTAERNRRSGHHGSKKIKKRLNQFHLHEDDAKKKQIRLAGKHKKSRKLANNPLQEAPDKRPRSKTGKKIKTCLKQLHVQEKDAKKNLVRLEKKYKNTKETLAKIPLQTVGDRKRAVQVITQLKKATIPTEKKLVALDKKYKKVKKSFEKSLSKNPHKKKKIEYLISKLDNAKKVNNRYLAEIKDGRKVNKLARKLKNKKISADTLHKNLTAALILKHANNNDYSPLPATTENFVNILELKPSSLAKAFTRGVAISSLDANHIQPTGSLSSTQNSSNTAIIPGRTTTPVNCTIPLNCDPILSSNRVEIRNDNSTNFAAHDLAYGAQKPNMTTMQEAKINLTRNKRSVSGRKDTNETRSPSMATVLDTQENKKISSGTKLSSGDLSGEKIVKLEGLLKKHNRITDEQLLTKPGDRQSREVKVIEAVVEFFLGGGNEVILQEYGNNEINFRDFIINRVFNGKTASEMIFQQEINRGYQLSAALPDDNFIDDFIDELVPKVFLSAYNYLKPQLKILLLNIIKEESRIIQSCRVSHDKEAWIKKQLASLSAPNRKHEDEDNFLANKLKRIKHLDEEYGTKVQIYAEYLEQSSGQEFITDHFIPIKTSPSSTKIYLNAGQHNSLDYQLYDKKNDAYYPIKITKNGIFIVPEGLRSSESQKDATTTETIITTPNGSSTSGTSSSAASTSMTIEPGSNMDSTRKNLPGTNPSTTERTSLNADQEIITRTGSLDNEHESINETFPLSLQLSLTPEDGEIMNILRNYNFYSGGREDSISFLQDAITLVKEKGSSVFTQERLRESENYQEISQNTLLYKKYSDLFFNNWVIYKISGKNNIKEFIIQQLRFDNLTHDDEILVDKNIKEKLVGLSTQISRYLSEKLESNDIIISYVFNEIIFREIPNFSEGSLSINSIEFPYINAGLLYAMDIGLERSQISLEEALEFGEMLHIQLQEDVAPKTWVDYFSLSAIIQYFIATQKNSEGLSLSTEEQGEYNVKTKALDYFFNKVKKYNEDNDPIKKFLSFLDEFKTRRQIAKENLDRFKCKDLSVENYLDGATGCVGDKGRFYIPAPYDNVNKIYDLQINKFADAFEEIDNLIVQTLFYNISDDDKNFISNAEVKRSHAEFYRGIDTKSPLFYDRLPTDILLFSAKYNNEERIYAIDRYKKIPAVILVNRELKKYAALMSRNKHIDFDYTSVKVITPKSDTTLKKRDESLNQLIYSIVKINKKRFYDELHEQGYEKTVVEILKNLSCSLLPLCSGIKALKEGEYPEAIVDFIFDAISFIPVLGQASKIAIATGKTVTMAGLVALRHALMQNTLKMALKTGTTSFVRYGIVPIHKIIINPKTLQTAGINLLRAIDPGVEMIMFFGKITKNSFKHMMNLGKRMSSKLPNLNKILEKFEKNRLVDNLPEITHELYIKNPVSKKVDTVLPKIKNPKNQDILAPFSKSSQVVNILNNNFIIPKERYVQIDEDFFKLLVPRNNQGHRICKRFPIPCHSNKKSITHDKKTYKKVIDDLEKDFVYHSNSNTYDQVAMANEKFSGFAKFQQGEGKETSFQHIKWYSRDPEPYNIPLREGLQDDKYVKALNNQLNQLPVATEISYRSQASPKGVWGSKVSVGDVVYTRTFLSTSGSLAPVSKFFSQITSNDRIIFRINGRSGKNISQYAVYKKDFGQSEILFSPGSTFEVLEISKRGGITFVLLNEKITLPEYMTKDIYDGSLVLG